MFYNLVQYFIFTETAMGIKIGAQRKNSDYIEALKL